MVKWMSNTTGFKLKVVELAMIEALDDMTAMAATGKCGAVNRVRPILQQIRK